MDTNSELRIHVRKVLHLIVTLYDLSAYLSPLTPLHSYVPESSILRSDRIKVLPETVR